MRYFGERNNVLFVDTIGLRTPSLSVRDAWRVWTKLRRIVGGMRGVAPNITVLSPPAVPFHGSRFARWLNERLVARTMHRAMRRLGMEAPLIWTYVPHALPIIERLPRSALIYHCIDDYGAITGAATETLRAYERRLCEIADVVATSSEYLAGRCRSDGGHVLYIPHAVDPAFGAAAGAVALPELDGVSSPIVDFVGRIGDWIDLGLIEALALRLPDWTIVLVGPSIVDLRRVEKYANVMHLGRKPYERIPSYIARFDVAIVPYVAGINQETRNPLKLYEYLAVGVPVVATEIREVVRFSGVISVVPADEFPDAVVAARKTDSHALRVRRQASVARRSWGDIAEEILRATDRAHGERGA